MSVGFRVAALATGMLALLAVSCPGTELGSSASVSLPLGVSPAGVGNLRAKNGKRRRLLARGAKAVRAAAVRRSNAIVVPETVLASQAGQWPEPSEAELTSLAADSAAASSPRVEPERALAALAKETFVFSEPDWSSRKLGYLRAGAIVSRSDKPRGHKNCEGGWYKIAPEGFVCAGASATLDVEHPVVQAAAVRPDRSAGMPYRYGMSLFPTPPFYARVPTADEQRRVEPEIETQKRKQVRDAWADVSLGPIPALFAAGSMPTAPNGFGFSPNVVQHGRAMVKSGFAFLGFFENEGRKFGLSVDLDVMPLDRLVPVTPSAFSGVALGDGIDLPVVFATTRGAALLTGDPEHGFRPLRPLAFREVLPVTGKLTRVAGQNYYETTHGEWLKDEGLTLVGPMRNRPGWATPGRTWIDISILKQSLIAYEGDKPVYVTLVSTGIDGLGDPEETHSTIRGQFLIHTKHVTATMSGDEVGDEFDLRDVPYVMYFNEGYALHAAYWHDSFGRPRSHGCVNLAPNDARWLFEWSDPPVPEGWHGAMSLREGTLVSIHP